MRKNRIFLSALLLSAVIMFGLGFVGRHESSVPLSSSSTSTPQTGQVSYVIYADGSYVKALDTSTGNTDFSGVDAAAVIMQAAKPNSKVLISAGTYIINHAASSQDSIIISNSNVELYGEGQEVTILKLADGANRRVLSIFQTSNVYIHDLQIDGNRMNQNQNTGAPAIYEDGISAWRSTGFIVSNTYVHDVRNFGITLSDCTNSRVLKNRIVNSDANGITIDNKESGSGITVRGNTVDGASDVGITAWYSNNFVAENNTVRNVMMNRSPYGGNDHVGMMVENAARKVTYRNNYIENCGTALSATGGTTIMFDTNTAHNCLMSLWADNVNELTVTNCVFDGIATAPQTNLPYFALDLDPGVASAMLTGNQFINVGPYLGAGAIVVQLKPPSGTFSNNIIDTANGKYQAIYIKTPSGWIVRNNTIITISITSTTTSSTSSNTSSPQPTSAGSAGSLKSGLHGVIVFKKKLS
jgi:parallel beta-helix repeat protein